MNLGIIMEDLFICINYILHVLGEKLILNASIWNYQLSLLIIISNKTLKVTRTKVRQEEGIEKGEDKIIQYILYISGN